MLQEHVYPSSLRFAGRRTCSYDNPRECRKDAGSVYSKHFKKWVGIFAGERAERT